MSVEVVGIDLSLSATGIATPHGLYTIKSEPTASDTIQARLARLGYIILRIQEHVNPLPGALVVVEGPSLGQRRQGGEHLRAGLWWLLIAHLDSAGFQVIEMSPAALKKFATGRGNATKADMRVALLQRAGLDVRDENQVDAYWLWQVGLHLVGATAAISLPKAQTAVLDKIGWRAP